MTAMTMENITPKPLTPMTFASRNDVYLVADVETRHNGKFNMTVFALPRNEENDSIIYKMKNGKHSFRCGDHLDEVQSYMTPTNGALTLRASMENWHYASWKDDKGETQNGWLCLENQFRNNEKMLGMVGSPACIIYCMKSGGKELPDRMNLRNPANMNAVEHMRVHFEELQEPFAVKGASFHMQANGRLNNIKFHKQNHPSLGVCSIFFGGAYRSLESMPEGAKKSDLPETLSYQDTGPLWDKIEQYGRTMTELCMGLKIPDASAYCHVPMIMKDINDMNFDGVAGNYCPALAKTYKRLDMRIR